MLKEIADKFGWRQNGEPGAKYRLALDIGTEFVKAVYVKMERQEATVVGVGRAAQDYADMESGAVANISGVVRCCRQAMEQGAIVAGVKPKEVVMGIAGQFVHGLARTITKTRPKPGKGITRQELRRLVKDAHKKALAGITKEISTRLGYDVFDIELVNSSLVSMTIDGYPIHNPLEFQGRNLELTIFMTFAPLVHAGAMRTIAARLGLDLIGMVAEPYAVAASTLTDEAYEFGSLVIDIGGGSTDIALVHKRGISGTKMMAMGGRAFTRGIAAGLHNTIREAEKLKLDYADGDGLPEIKSIIDEDLDIWSDGLLIALQDLYAGTPLSSRIALCGGGSGLPGIVERISSDKFIKSGLFSQKPEVTLLKPSDIYGISDPKELLRGPEDVTPKGIAYQAALIQPEERGLLGGAKTG